VPIEFGSDGFRGIIGHDLTRSSVTAITLGAVQFAQSVAPDTQQQVIPVGYDTRFLAREFAELASRIIKTAGHTPLLAHRPCPSPYLAFATHRLGAQIGLQFTASHNPPQYGGIKLKGSHGGSLLPEHVELVQFYANETSQEQLDASPALIPDHASDQLMVEEFDFSKEYSAAILAAAGWNGDQELPLIVDCMHGTGAGIYLDILRDHFEVLEALRTEPDPLFGGSKPEPLAANLKHLSEQVLIDLHGALGLAFDGDGDRLAVLDEHGNCLAPHEIYCILLEHVVNTRGIESLRVDDEAPVVVASVSFSGLVERVARARGLLLHEVPVGYKHVTRAMISTNAIMGGEESGGTGFGHHLPERDALLMALLLLHARRRAGMPLYEMVSDLYARFGRPVFLHLDYQLPSTVDKEVLRERLREMAKSPLLAGDKVTGLNHSDGMKLKTSSGWALVRISGTEPILRIYAEGESETQARDYAEAALKLMGMVS
jgi:phosphomannomutase